MFAAAAPFLPPATMTHPTESFRLWGAETHTGGLRGASAARVVPLALAVKPAFLISSTSRTKKRLVLLVSYIVLLVPYIVLLVPYTILLVPHAILLPQVPTAIVPHVPSTVLLAWYSAGWIASYTVILLASYCLYRSVIFYLLERLISNLRIISL